MSDVTTKRGVVEMKALGGDPQVAAVMQLLAEQNREIIERLGHLEKTQALGIVKEGYTVEDVCARLNGKRKPFTVRQWCNEGQVKAKKVTGQGRRGEWRIGPDELARIQADGPLPKGTFDNKSTGDVNRTAA